MIKIKHQNLNKLSIILVMFGLVLFICTGCKRDTDFQNKVTLPGTINPDVVTANTKFGFNLFNEIRKTDQDKNIFISPFSVSVALAMTLNGAAGETEQAMINTLQLQNIDTEAINPDYAQLQQTLLSSDPKVKLTIANSLWTRQGYTFNPNFLQRNTEFFDAEISTLDFLDPNSVHTINQWVNTNTKGKIPKILERISPEEVLFLINAIYFKGSWQTEFDPSNTRDSPFYLATGDSKQVPMMSRTGGYPYYQGENFQAISLPYGDGKVSMYIFLPSRASDFNTFLESLNAESWENWISQLQIQKVRVQIPKFKLKYGIGLTGVLKVLGMGIAFNPGLADFSRMVPTGVSFGGDLFITRVTHGAIVEVDEKGTVAAAVTLVGAGITSVPPPPPEFIADRPFFFAIRDNETKTVLFMGTVLDPSSEDPQ